MGLPGWHRSRCSGRKGWPTSPHNPMMGSRCRGWRSAKLLETLTSLVWIPLLRNAIWQSTCCKDPFLLTLWLLTCQNKAAPSVLKQNGVHVTAQMPWSHVICSFLPCVAVTVSQGLDTLCIEYSSWWWYCTDSSLSAHRSHQQLCVRVCVRVRACAHALKHPFWCQSMYEQPSSADTKQASKQAARQPINHDSCSQASSKESADIAPKMH